MFKVDLVPMEYVEKGKNSSLPEKANNSLEYIPKHVIQRICTYFSSPELNIENLSKTWSSISEHPLLWLKLEFRGEDTSANTICRILRNSPLLESLRLTNVPDVVSILRQMCRCCKRLKHLAVRFSHIGDDLRPVSVPETALRNVICSCPNLISLDLKGTPFSGRLFYQELAHLRKLRVLKLGCNSLLCPQDLFTIATVCRGRLTHLSIIHSVNGMAPPPMTIQEVPKTLRRPERDRLSLLREFSKESDRCVSQPLTSRECSFLVEMLGTGLISLELETTAVEGHVFRLMCDLCTNLRCLRLFNAMNLPGDVLRQLSSAMPHLTHLAFRRAYLPSEEDLVELFLRGKKDKWSGSGDVLLPAESLEDDTWEGNWWDGGFPSDDSEIGSGGTNIDDEMMCEEVTESALPFLKSLELSMCPAVSDAVLNVLTEGPTANTLHTLRIRGCQRVTSEGLALLRKCSRLRHLDVSYVDSKRGPSAEWLKCIPGDLPSLDMLIVGFWKEDVEKEKAMEEVKRTKPSLQIRKCLSFYDSKEVHLT